jgi:hypothetical protein
MQGFEIGVTGDDGGSKFDKLDVANRDARRGRNTKSGPVYSALT